MRNSIQWNDTFFEHPSGFGHPEFFFRFPSSGQLIHQLIEVSGMFGNGVSMSSLRQLPITPVIR